jgi:hypothetical protein
MDWIEVDALAQAWAVGILAEPFRWAELEQLVYSSDAMERRLVGSTLATMTLGRMNGINKTARKKNPPLFSGASMLAASRANEIGMVRKKSSQTKLF